MILEENIGDICYWAFRTVTPWKIRFYGNPTNYKEAYVKGWNACLKEIKKRQKKYIKNLSEIKTV